MNKAWEEFQATLPEPMRSNIEQASRSITREAFEFAWQAALRQQGEQEGMVLVPVKPTSDMCAAGYYAHGFGMATCAKIYKAMIAAK